MSEYVYDIKELSGIGDVSRKKLNEIGVYTVRDLMLYSPIQLAGLLNTSVDRAEKMVLNAYNFLKEKKLIPDDFVTADLLMEEVEKRKYITTGSKNLDSLLGKGVPTRALTEFYGEFGVGKTQICHVLAVDVQLPPDRGGLDKNTIYIDTEKTFSPSRIVDIAEARGLDPKLTLKRIYVAKVYSSPHLMTLTRFLPKKIREDNIGFIAVDSATAPFRAEYLGRGMLAERQQMLNRFMHNLVDIADLYDVAVVITNQAQAAPDILYGDPTKAVGGHVVAHAVTYRIYLRKGGKGARVASVKDSPEHPPSQTVFMIAKEGVVDVEK